MVKLEKVPLEACIPPAGVLSSVQSPRFDLKPIPLTIEP